MDLKAKFATVTTKTYSEQAKFFMNAFWGYGVDKEAENIWKFAQKCIELDTDKKKNGNELDEFKAHKFLEDIGETKTVVELRETLRKIDIDMNKRMALVEYLIFKYSKKVEDLVSNPQGDPKQLDEAQAKLNAVMDALQELQTQLEQQQQDLELQRQAEAVVKQAETELKIAVDDLNKQEQDYHNQINALETKAKDQNVALVARRTAENTLAQLKQGDPLPLRKAKITQEAALRRVEKERKKAEEATRALEEQKKKVEATLRDTEKKVQEATEYVEKVKKNAVPSGSIWWIERELKDAQRFLPQKKQTL